MRRHALGLWVMAGIGGAAGCGGAPPVAATRQEIAAAAPRREVEAAPRPVAQGASTEAPRCARRHPGAGPTRADTLRQGSAVALARLGDTTVAYAADDDDDAIHTFDVDHAAQLAVTPLAGTPAQLLVLADGRVAVTLRHENRVIVLEPGERVADPMTVLCDVATPAEPFGLAATPDDARLLVTSGWGHALTVLDAGSLEALRRVDLPREPRGVMVDDDGRRAFVTHLVGGRLSVVDLADPARPVHEIALRPTETSHLPGSHGYALARVSVEPGAPARILAPLASVNPGPAAPSFGYGGGLDIPTVQPMVGVVDPVAERVLPRTHRIDFSTHRKDCLLPRAAAATGAGGLLVACQGIDALIELDARSLDPTGVERRRFRVPAGPTGVAMDAGKDRAVVWSQFARELSVVALSSGEDAALRVPAAHKPVSRLTEKEQRGRRIFHATDDPRVSRDGRACASCHPEGRDDSLTWSTPDGPRQTIMLAGRVTGTEPYGWFGVTRSVRDHVARTFKRLGGTGLLADKDREDFDGLVAYLAAMTPPSTTGALRDPARAALAARGREVFLEGAQGCSTCHLGGGTDKTAHDVKSGNVDETSIKFDTPSLRFVGGTAPYFHDGRYTSLEDLLERSDGKMGHTIGLPRPDLLALVAYLEDL
jgi:hypothetical protein